jgi:UrcA family protein
LSAFGAGAYADTDDPGTITITAPHEKVVGREFRANTPIVQVSSTAHVRYRPVALTTNSGVALLKDRVARAAREMCADLDPFAAQDWSCVRRAIDEAQPQIDAAIARAEESSNS